MKVTPGVVLKFMGEIEAILTREGVLDAAGNFVNPAHPQAAAKAAVDVEQLLKAKGIAVQVKVDQAINALPLVFGLLGLQ